MKIDSQKRKAILLVGGFGDNDFLLHRLRQAFPKIPIQRPTNAYGIRLLFPITAVKIMVDRAAMATNAI